MFGHLTTVGEVYVDWSLPPGSDQTRVRVVCECAGRGSSSSLRDAPTEAGVPAPAAVSRSTNCRLQAVSRRSILAFSSWR